MHDADMLIQPIGHIYTVFEDTFAIPRQSGLCETAPARIVLEEEYRRSEAIRGIQSFSHLWIIWQFSEHKNAPFHPTVRPPRLGGNRRVGVFASRSPFRPNHLGLSCVSLLGIDRTCADAPVLIVGGADCLNGTPIYDIKPYLPFCDCKPDAVEGYTAETKQHGLTVVCDQSLFSVFPIPMQKTLRSILEQDPRPGYHPNKSEPYGFHFAGYEIKFTVSDNVLTVCSVESCSS